MTHTVNNRETDPGRSSVATSARAVRWLALTSLVFSLSFAAAALAIMILGWSTEVPPRETPPVLYPVFLAITFSTVGAVAASRRRENAVGWIMCAIGLLFALNTLADSYAIHALYTKPEPLPGAAFAAWATVFTGNIGILSFLLLLFPDGRLPSRRWRPVVWFVIATTLAEVAFWAFAPGRFRGWPSARNPFGVDALRPFLDPYVTYVQTPLVVLAVLLPVMSLLVRFRRSRGVERQQLKWIASSGALVAFAVTLLILVGTRSPAPIEDVLWGFLVLTICAVPVCIGMAILRYRLWDIDLVISHAFVYGALTTGVVGIYVLVVGGLGTLLRVQDNILVSILAAGLIAVLFQPLRHRLQRGVNHLIYGERDEPHKVLSRLGQRLEATIAPDAALKTIVETIAQALKLPYAAITLTQDGKFVTAAEYGNPSSEPLLLPLAYGPETVGQLVLGPRAPGESFTVSDLRLLEDLARQIGVTAYAVRLTLDLQRSRERLVTAREDERRRLRRDLHDGVGPQLAALTLKLETARNRLTHDPAADALLSDLAERARVAVSDVRRSVHALRPPALDELGLVPALRETAAQYSQGGLRISVVAPQNLPSLPAAVEVAAYHIAQEAMTNAVHHADAQSCVLCLELERETSLLRVRIEDDGRGIGTARGKGVGLTSMRERAEELGGTCLVEPVATHGTRVLVELPCFLESGT